MWQRGESPNGVPCLISDVTWLIGRPPTTVAARWQSIGAVPEPGSLLLAAMSALLVVGRRRGA